MTKVAAAALLGVPAGDTRFTVSRTLMLEDDMTPEPDSVMLEPPAAGTSAGDSDENDVAAKTSNHSHINIQTHIRSSMLTELKRPTERTVHATPYPR